MNDNNANCSFCRKHFREAGPLIEGCHEAYICGECIELCQSIIDQEKRRRLADEEMSRLTAEVIQQRLDQLLGEHEQVHEPLALAAYRHWAGLETLHGRAVLLIGPTLSSKVVLGRALAHVIGAPFAEEDLRGVDKAEQGRRSAEPVLYQLLRAIDLGVTDRPLSVRY